MNYEIEYSSGNRGDSKLQSYSTDDPIACENFLVDLLERGQKIRKISHGGDALSQDGFDRMIKAAAGILAKNHVCKSLGVDSLEAHYRFGVPA